MTQKQREQAARVLDNTVKEIRGYRVSLMFSGSDDYYQELVDKAEAETSALDTAIAALREPEWVRTADRLPTEADAGVDEEIVTIYDDGETRVMGTDYWAYVAKVPERFPYWLPVPKLPEVEG